MNYSAPQRRLATPFASELLDNHSPFITANTNGPLAYDLEEIAYIRSIDRNDVIRGLGNIFLEEVSTQNPDIAARLETYLVRILAISPQQAPRKDKNIQSVVTELSAARAQEAADQSLEQLAQENYDAVRGDVNLRNHYLAHMAQLSQLIELAGHLSRENFFDIKRAQRDADPTTGGVPGGIERILYNVRDDVDEMLTKGDRKYIYSSVEEAIKYLNIPVLDLSLTQHPTNVLTLKTILLKRAIHDAARETCLPPETQLEHLKKQIRAYANNELTPVDADGKITNFNAEDELDITLDTVQQVDTNITDLYGTYERAFTRRWGELFTPSQRWEMNFNLRINSWVMGDKDGNMNVKAEHLLLATVKHRLTALNIALKHADAIGKQGVTIGQEWIEPLQNARQTLAGIKNKLDTARYASGGIDLVLPQEEFDHLSRTAALALGEDWQSFETHYMDVLRHMGKTASPSQNDALLAAHRSLRVFGLRGAKIELRETSEQYSTVIATLVKHDAAGKPVDYAKLGGAEQARLLNALITQKPEYLVQQAKNFLATADAAKLRNYKGDVAADTITYHTLKRYQEAANNPDLYTDNIIAECKDAQNMLEVVALQKMSAGVSEAPMRMHVVPLFEEFKTLRSIGKTLKSAFYYRAYRDHMLGLVGGNLQSLLQKYQIAHSDNIRRSGTPAGRGGIHVAHRQVPLQMKAFEGKLAKLFANGGIYRPLTLTTEVFEGLSLSHILRGGGRALSAMTNAFKLHRHTKLTVQGADQQSYLGLASSFKRMTARFFAHSAKELALEDNANPPPDSSPLVEKAISDAFKSTMPDYVNQHFGPEKNPKSAGMGHLLAHPIINYFVYGIVGNRGMRNAARAGAKKTDFINTDTGTRAIGISENMFDADLLNTWFGSAHIADNLAARLLNGKAVFNAYRRQVNSYFGTTIVAPPPGKRPLTTKELSGLYKTSPQFRDVVDQMACGLVASNVNRLQKRLTNYAEKSGTPMAEPIRDYVFKTLPKDYIKAAEFVLGAFGISYDQRANLALSDNDKILYLRHLVASYAIPTYATEYGVKMRFATAAVLARDEILGAEKPNAPLTAADYRALSDLFAARAIASHGRVFSGEDPHYASSLRHFVKRFAQPGLEPV